ncbi:flagellar hook-length control protein FliK [Pantoea sp. Mb-10]|uniref:flagellar hook-length control protein FliK n=1 Tax=unclassified Pantoea TaxID=2630326 RepID=UPI001E6365F9|nr:MULTISPECIES: flagellar hook-length control protein FliK [unclassified Pantoea]MCE0489853.1 flagellar hook-length control protein FliK [Pantoea sp. Mb-10]MCE0501041.1 flagellar hook-length control protein FliK [Pantoea sp. Pb-8]
MTPVTLQRMLALPGATPHQPLLAAAEGSGAPRLAAGLPAVAAGSPRVPALTPAGDVGAPHAAALPSTVAAFVLPDVSLLPVATPEAEALAHTSGDHTAPDETILDVHTLEMALPLPVQSERALPATAQLAGAGVEVAVMPARGPVVHPQRLPARVPRPMSVTAAGESVPLAPAALGVIADALATREHAQRVETRWRVMPMPRPQSSLPTVLPLPAATGAAAPSADLQQTPLALPEAEREKALTLKTALGERLHLQIAQSTQKATIRLDPPHLGKVEVSIHYEEGKLQVHIQAAQPEVYRALQQVSHELRGTLSEENSVTVNVQISQQQSEQRQNGQSQPRSAAPIAGHEPCDERAERQSQHDHSILTTV